jgi:hypothetical protein
LVGAHRSLRLDGKDAIDWTWVEAEVSQMCFRNVDITGQQQAVIRER